MSKVQMLRGLVEQRLTAAAEEIFGLFERTIAEYEEELCRSKEENERQRKRLDAVFSPQLRLHRAELPQQHVCKEEEVLSDQQLCIQERNSSLDQKDQDPPQIKEEQEQLCTNQWGKRLVLKQETDTFSHSNNVNNTNMSEIHHVQQLSVVKAEVPPEQQEWSSSLGQKDPDPPHIKEEQEGQQIQGLEDADIKFPSTSVPVKKEEDDEKAQSSQLHESQTEENREAERTGADGEDCGGPEPARNSDPDIPLQPATHDKTSDSSESESETDDSADWEETSEPQTGLSPLPNNEEPVSDVGCNTGNTSVSSSECAGSFGRKKHLQKHSGVQTGGKPFSCSVCGKRYLRKKTLTTHMKLHSEEKCSTCSVCKASFCQPGNLDKHMRIHTGEKPFSCSICSKRFTQKQHLKPHLAVHKGEKPFSCSICSKRFTQKQHLKQHLTSHTGEKPFSCSVCSKSYALKQHLKRHLTSHTGEKLFSCSVCDKRFAHKQHLNTHLPIHAGEKPFSCSVCGKRFTLKQSLKKHLRIHNGEK